MYRTGEAGFKVYDSSKSCDFISSPGLETASTEARWSATAKNIHTHHGLLWAMLEKPPKLTPRNIELRKNILKSMLHSLTGPKLVITKLYGSLNRLK